MVFTASDPTTQLAFSIQENKGVFAVLLGSGVSRSSQIPTGWEVTLDLVRRVAAAQGIDAQPDWAAWYQAQTGIEPNYSTLLAELASTPAERRSILDSYIEPTAEDREEGKKVPTLAHRSIANLVRGGYVKVILTTNFDRLMENALRDVGVEPTIISSSDALEGALPITHSSCYLVKLHGDYKDARILNTDEELRAYQPSIDRLLDRIFDEYGLVVCGWSGEWDHALRSAILRAPSRRFPTYFTSRSKPAEPAKALIDHRQAKLVSIEGADQFFSALAASVETLEKAHRPSPQSLELLIGSAKRFLSKPEHRIQLHDLMGDEAERLAKAIFGDQFPLSKVVDSAEFADRVARYEGATEPLARAAGVVGRWGDDEALSLILEVIDGIYRQGSVPASGNGFLCNFRTYPVFLVAASCAIALVHAGRWQELKEFFSHQLPDSHRGSDRTRLVDELFLNAWAGATKEVWNLLPGQDRMITPVSNHLMELMSAWSSSFIGPHVDLEALFYRYELLGTVAYFEAAALDGAMEHMKSRRQHFTWLPIGRLMCFHDLDARLDTILSSSLTPKLTAAGLFGDDPPARIEAFRMNYKLLASKIGFGWGG